MPIVAESARKDPGLGVIECDELPYDLGKFSDKGA